MKLDLNQRKYEVIITRPPLPTEHVRAVLALYDAIKGVK